jgi:hypothetical protein
VLIYVVSCCVLGICSRGMFQFFSAGVGKYIEVIVSIELFLYCLFFAFSKFIFYLRCWKFPGVFVNLQRVT